MEILINLIASIIFAILGAVSYRYLYLPYMRRTNALSRLSPLDFSKDPVYLCYGLVSPSEPDKHYTVAQGDLSAVTLGYQILAGNYGGERVRIQNCVVTEPHVSEVSNLLAISGPRWNSVTKRYMGRLGSPLRFTDDRKALILRKRDRSRETFTNTYRPSGDPEVCYGIILGGVMRHSDRKQNVVICAGSNSFSTYGCVIILDDLRHSRSLRRMRRVSELKNEPRWGLIVRVQNLSTASAEPQGRQPFERSQLEVVVERSLTAAEFSEPYVYSPAIE
ncbi:MAG: hypothetical protein ACREXR_15300 [Gammaproteobacteria bacterium]